MDFCSLIKDTSAYKSIKHDKDKGMLSHAYLVVIPDEENLKEYLKVLAKLILCPCEEPCNDCRVCSLIDSENYRDLLIFPKDKDSVTVEDAKKLIEESYFRPVEGDKKVFILSSAQTMNAQSQNKILKTLEEPPKNVHIIMGTTSEFPLLSTIKSRVKKLEVAPFSNAKLISALKDKCPDEKRLERAVAYGDGTVSKALSLYGDENLNSLSSLVLDMLENMKTSREVLKYSMAISKFKGDFLEFLSVLELYFRDMLLYYSGKKELVTNKEILSSPVLEVGYNASSCVYALEKIEQAKVRKKFNANATMLLEWLLFQILEGKHKWRKC